MASGDTVGSFPLAASAAAGSDAGCGADCGAARTDDEALVQAFRSAMRRLAAPVTLITARDTDGTRHGMVASAVMSVSMQPPSLLVGVNRSASIHRVLQRTQRFCVNLLAEQQGSLLALFADPLRREQRFAGADWRDGALALPYHRAATCAVFCEVALPVVHGSHSLFLGRVVDVRLAPGEPAPPLLWFDGAPAALRRLREAA